MVRLLLLHFLNRKYGLLKIKKEKQKLQLILDELEKLEAITVDFQNAIEKEQKYIDKMVSRIDSLESVKEKG